MAVMFDSKFPLGMVVATRGAIDHISPPVMNECVRRHAQGDWGDMCDDDKHENDYVLNQAPEKRYGRIFSAYDTEDGKLWVITEGFNSSDPTYPVTTVLLPEEY